ncbi:MAG: hypothetical protein J3K34DRAFT_42505 [Monoraphidium minutum]|nr:MAG: hypothetical protein J3K34DRAFT_42505 [Monoraphidium minutum]
MAACGGGRARAQAVRPMDWGGSYSAGAWNGAFGCWLRMPRQRAGGSRAACNGDKGDHKTRLKNVSRRRRRGNGLLRGPAAGTRPPAPRAARRQGGPGRARLNARRPWPRPPRAARAGRRAIACGSTALRHAPGGLVAFGGVAAPQDSRPPETAEMRGGNTGDACCCLG